MSSVNEIEMVFYAHPWSVHLLEDQIIDKRKKNVLIEVATDSNLSFLCGDKKTGPNRGVLPLLTHPAQVDVRRLAREYPLIPAPLVLAANPPLTREALLHSLMALDSRKHSCDTIYLLVHIFSAAQFECLYPMVSKFSILWDAADYPSAELVACAQGLQKTESLQDGRWGGFHVGSHWLRETPDAPANRAAVEQLLTAAAL